MLEKIGDNDVIVRNYSGNFNVKEFVQEELIPKAFPDIPMNRLNLGFTGVISEYMGQVIEDSQAQGSLSINEAFITKAVLPSSIYAEAAVYGLGYRFAVPSKCSFAIEIRIDDIIDNAEPVTNSSTYRYILDKNTRVILGSNSYELDYDVYIDYTFINGKRVYNVYFNMDEPNSISKTTNKYIKHQVASTGWLVLFMDLLEFNRKSDVASITDNIITTNSEIEITWIKQIAGLDLIYVSPTGQRLRMKLKGEYTEEDVEPFAWYRFVDDNTIALSFSSSSGYWMPEFNSKIEYTVYTTLGKAGEFVSYDRQTNVPVKKSGEKYPYNAETEIVALCYSGSTGAEDRGDIEQLRRDIITEKNTVDVLTTANDMDLWFNNFGRVYGTESTFFKRRDDPSGTLFAQFIAIKDGSYIYPTNTLGIKVYESEFDYVDGNEFIIQPGHLWVYDTKETIDPDTHNPVIEESRTTLKMLGTSKITDATLPPEVENNKISVFVNPFLIKINKQPTTSATYNYLIDDTSWPEDVPINSDYFYQFQLATFSIKRTLSSEDENKYHFELVCVPVITTDESVTYVSELGKLANLRNNSLRIIMVTDTTKYGETGYIEMIPMEKLEGGAYLFAADIAVTDGLGSDMTIEVDLTKTPNMKQRDPAVKVFMDSQETSFYFNVLMSSAGGSGIFGDPDYDGYIIANKFRNNNNDLTLYKTMSMMRSAIKFDTDDSGVYVEMSLIPFLKWDIPLDTEKMTYFTQAFQEQYKKIEPIEDKLNGDSFLDVKLYNTYGKSNNYFVGPEDGVPNLKDSTIKLDNVYVSVNIVISVYDRSLYTQTAADVKNQIIKCFDELNASDNTDLHVSNIIHDIVQSNSNVRYIRFIGFNGYSANQQSIFVKYTDVSELTQGDLMTRVPEIIRADEYSISITEET